MADLPDKEKVHKTNYPTQIGFDKKIIGQKVNMWPAKLTSISSQSKFYLF